MLVACDEKGGPDCDGAFGTTPALEATTSLILLTSAYYGAMYGGRISSILLNIPGDEPAMMTCLDGDPMAQKGLADEALSLSGIASFVGAFFATRGLIRWHRSW